MSTKNVYSGRASDRLGLVQRKYKTEIGESMGKPEKKLKKIILILGVTGAVYGSFRFLLPLAAPFLLAWGAAVCFRKPARALSRVVRFRLSGRQWALPEGAAGALELALSAGLLGAGLYVGGQKLFLEASMLVDRIPDWIRALDIWLTGVCHNMETALCLKRDVLVALMREMLRGLFQAVKEGAMPYVMTNSLAVFRAGAACLVVGTIVLVGTGLCIQEMDLWKARCRRCLYCKELALIGRRIKIVANAYLKTQGIIMLLTTAVCTLGLWLMGNPYALLVGVGIGLLDALPVFGTGTVLIPWAAVLLLSGRWGQGLWIMGLYVLCYFLRQVLEARLMADRVGLSPLETLVAIYVGFQLWGLLGLFLGPVGLLLSRDLTESLWQEYEEEREKGKESR